MGNNLVLAQQIPAGAFDPQPDSATLAANLVKVGIFIASSAISSALKRPPPHPVVAMGNYMQYAFEIALAVIFLFGVGMILIGWMVSDAPPGTHTAMSRIMLRASQIVLVFAIALHEFASTSTTQANYSTTT